MVLWCNRAMSLPAGCWYHMVRRQVYFFGVSTCIRPVVGRNGGRVGRRDRNASLCCTVDVSQGFALLQSLHMLCREPFFLSSGLAAASFGCCGLGLNHTVLAKQEYGANNCAQERRSLVLQVVGTLWQQAAACWACCLLAKTMGRCAVLSRNAQYSFASGPHALLTV